MFDLLSHFISSVTCILKGDPKGQSVCLELDKFLKYELAHAGWFQAGFPLKMFI